MQDYNVKPIGRVCAGTGKELTPGSLCHSVLVEKNGELQRFDYAADGWPSPPPQFVAHWQCQVPEPQTTAKKQSLNPDELMQQFEQLCEEASPAQDKFRYVLALLLLRRHRLRLDSTKIIDDQPFLEVTGTRGEGSFLVPELTLNDAEVEQLQQSLFPSGAAA